MKTRKASSEFTATPLFSKSKEQSKPQDIKSCFVFEQQTFGLVPIDLCSNQQQFKLSI